MSLSVFLILMTGIVLAVAVFLILSLIKLNRVLDNADTLLTNVNKTLPPVLSEIQNVSSEVNTIVSTVTRSVQQTASGLEYLRAIKMETALELIGIVHKLIKIFRRFVRRRDKHE